VICASSDLCQQRSEWFSGQLATIRQELAQVGYCLRHSYAETDRQCPDMPGDNFSNRTATLGHETPKLAVAGGHADLVAEQLADVEGALVLAGGLLIVPAILGEPLSCRWLDVR
jgi:hypothetical protein